jgi:hypothetical protein
VEQDPKAALYSVRTRSLASFEDQEEFEQWLMLGADYDEDRYIHHERYQRAAEQQAQLSGDADHEAHNHSTSGAHKARAHEHSRRQQNRLERCDRAVDRLDVRQRLHDELLVHMRKLQYDLEIAALEESASQLGKQVKGAYSLLSDIAARVDSLERMVPVSLSGSAHSKPLATLEMDETAVQEEAAAQLTEDVGATRSEMRKRKKIRSRLGSLRAQLDVDWLDHVHEAGRMNQVSSQIAQVLADYKAEAGGKQVARKLADTPFSKLLTEAWEQPDAVAAAAQRHQHQRDGMSSKGEMEYSDSSNEKAVRLLKNQFCTTAASEKPADLNHLPVGLTAWSDAVYCSIDDETARQLTDPTADEMSFSPLFPLLAPGAAPRYQSLRSTLPVGTEWDESVQQNVVVDTGASFTAISRKVMERDYKQALQSVRPAKGFSFVDASGRRMPVTGKVEVRLCIQDHCFWTTAFVFDELGTDVLLGINSIVDGKLDIQASRGKMSTADEDGRRVEVNVHYTSADEAGEVPVAAVLRFGTGSEQLEMNCEVAYTEHPPLKERVPADLIPLYSARSVTIPAAVRGVEVSEIPIVLNEWSAGPARSYLLEPSSLLREYGLSSAACRHSSMNAVAFVRAANDSPKSVTVPKGTLVGHAVLEPAEEVARPPSKMLAAILEPEDLSKKAFEDGGPPRTEADLLSLGLDFRNCIDPSRPLGNGKYAALPQSWKDRLIEVALRHWMVWSRTTRAPRISRLVVIDIPTGDATPIAQKPYPIAHRYIDAFRDELQKLLDEGLIEPSISNWASPVLLTVKKDSTAGALKVKLVCDYRKLNAVTVNDTGSLGTQDEILNSFGGGQRYVAIADMAGGFYQFCIAPDDRKKTAFVLPSAMGGTTFQWRVASYGLCRMPAAYSRGVMFALQGLQDVPLSPLGYSTGGVHSWLDDVIMHADSLEGFVDLFERVLMRLNTAGMTLKGSKTDILHGECEVLGYLVTPDGLRMNPKKTEAISRMTFPSTPEEVLVYLGSVNFYRRFVPKLAMLAKPLTDMLRKGGTYDQEGVDSACRAINHYLVSGEMLSFPDFADPYAEFVICTDASEVAVGAVLMQWQHPDTPRGTKPPEGTPARGEKGRDPITQSWRLGAGWKLSTIGYYAKTLDTAQSHYTVFDKEAGAILLALRQYADIVTGYPTTVYTDSSVAASMLYKYKGTARLSRWGMELMSFLPHLKIGHRAGKENGMADLLSRFPYFQKYVKEPEHEVEIPDDLFEQVAAVHWRQRDPLGCSTSVYQAGGAPYVKLNIAVRPTDHFLLYDARNYQEPNRIWQGDEDVERLGGGGVAVQGNAPEGVVSEVPANTPEGVVSEVPVNAPGLEPSGGTAPGTPETAAPGDEAERLTDEGARRNSRRGVRRCSRLNDDGLEANRNLEGEMGGHSRGLTTQQLMLQLDSFKQSMQRTKFYEEQAEYEGVQGHWDQYVDAFIQTYGRKPVLYDLYCGEGGFSRGARAAGAKCIGFDVDPHFARGYDTDPVVLPGGHRGRAPSGMQFVERDVDSPDFWEELRAQGCITGYPAPDMIHASPPCQCFSKLNNLSLGQDQRPKDEVQRVDHLIQRLQRVGDRWNLVWQVENVPESRPHVAQPTHQVTLCGTMMGHHVLRHRTIYSGHPVVVGLKHSHEGKTVGSRGMRRGSEPDEVAPNLYGIYSRRQVGRGTYDEWHGALGQAPDTYSRRGIAGVLPLGYGRYLTAQMVARVMSRREGVPVYLHQTVTAHQREMLAEMARHGCPRPAERAVRASALEGVVAAEIFEVDAGADELTEEEEVPWHGQKPSPYQFGAEEQEADPACSALLEALADADSPASQTGEWAVRRGLLFRRDVSVGGAIRLRLYVPASHQHALMHHSHHTLNSGHRSKNLYYDLATRYYWSGMHTACDKFVLRCKRCRELQPAPQTRVHPGDVMAEPERPFQVLHVDYKTALPTSGGYRHILVVVCKLTRYCIFIPTATNDAAQTFRLLFMHVFCHYGIPQKIISDNGPEFSAALSKEMGEYMGYRNIYVLPYNPQANGVAEAAVKRLKVLLERHTLRFREWHKMLPMVQYTLNTSHHLGIKMVPFEAVFGREATKLPELENPSTIQPRQDGSEFLQTLRARLRALHDALRFESEGVRVARRHAAQAATPHDSVVVKEGDIVWLHIGSRDQARRIRKSGHGEPWRNQYRVTAVNDFSVRVEPVGNSPRLMDWQPLHRVTLSPPDFHDDDYQHYTDNYGRSLAGPSANQPARAGVHEPFGNAEIDGPPPSDDGTYIIEKVVSAERRRGSDGRMRWYFRLKWEGYQQPTEETRAWLFKAGNTGRDVRAMAKQAMARAIMQGSSESSQVVDVESDEDDRDDDDDDEEQPAVTAEVFSVLSVPSRVQDWMSGMIAQALRAVRSLC